MAAAPPSASHAHSLPGRVWHQVRVRLRLVISILVGAGAFLFLPTALTLSTRVLMTWDIGAGLYLLLAWHLIGGASVEHMKWRARLQDEGAAAILALTVAAALASIAAIVLELAGIKTYPATRQGLHVALAGATFLASWLLVHTSFALHYAHAYYIAIDKEGRGPLEFPRQEAPTYMDFLYFSLVVGMTSQTADVAIASTRMRRLVMAHGIIAFTFNTTLLALAINIAASLLG